MVGWHRKPVPVISDSVRKSGAWETGPLFPYAGEGFCSTFAQYYLRYIAGKCKYQRPREPRQKQKYSLKSVDCELELAKFAVFELN